MLYYAPMFFVSSAIMATNMMIFANPFFWMIPPKKKAEYEIRVHQGKEVIHVKFSKE